MRLNHPTKGYSYHKKGICIQFVVPFTLICDVVLRIVKHPLFICKSPYVRYIVLKRPLTVFRVKHMTSVTALIEVRNKTTYPQTTDLLVEWVFFEIKQRTAKSNIYWDFIPEPLAVMQFQVTYFLQTASNYKPLNVEDINIR